MTEPMHLNEQESYEHHADELVGSSTAMQGVYQQIKKASSCNIPVLLIGDTGTGKEVAATTIHKLSMLRDKSFIPVNLGAIPETLISSVLFGHEKGAFTGADRLQRGIFERGNDGTVFLDEIGAIDYKAQIGLLRLLEEKKFNRLGGEKSIASNARIIAASNEDLKEKSKDGAFRQDLFYRLDVFSIRLPLLKDRTQDIPELADYFIAKFNRSMSRKVKGMTEETLDLLKEYGWPGNVRELKNVIQHAIIICDDDQIQPQHLPARINKMNAPRRQVTFRVGTSLRDVEREMILRTLEVANDNRTQAAELLGITRRAIYNKLNKHNIA